jgi:hypothetical protein
MEGFLGFLVILFLFAIGLTLLMHRDWRWILAALGAQYFLAFLLILPSWPLELAAVKLVAGWMAGAILGLTRLNVAYRPEEVAKRVPTSPAFLILSSALLVLVVLGSAPQLADWARQLSLNQAWGGLLVIGMGFLQVGFGVSNFRSIVGLLSLLCGFEILYAAVEASLLVAALLGVLNLGIALIGSFMLLVPELELRE